MLAPPARPTTVFSRRAAIPHPLPKPAPTHHVPHFPNPNTHTICCAPSARACHHSFTPTMFSTQVKDETVLAALKRILAELDWQNPDAEEVAFEEEEEESTDTRTHGY